MLKFRVNKTGPLFKGQPKRKTAKASKRAMTKTMKETERDIKRSLKRSPGKNIVGGLKTGAYKRSIRGHVKNSFEFVLKAHVPYSDIVEYGRKPSNKKVRPKSARALRFKFRGATSYSYRAWTRPFKRTLKGTHLFEKAAKALSGRRSKYIKNMNREITKAFG